MPFGQPIEVPRRKLPCGCVVLGAEDSAPTVVKYCPDHWSELGDGQRRQFLRERRSWLIDGLLGLALRVVVLGLCAAMVWMVWRAVTGSGR